MGKRIRKCIACEKEYEYCGVCEADAGEPKWKMLFCSDNCRKVFHAVSDYLQYDCNTIKTKEKLSDCDVSNHAAFNFRIKETLDKLFPVDEPEVETADEVKEVKEIQKKKRPVKAKKVEASEEVISSEENENEN